MPKLKNYGPGRRINIWVPERHLKILADIENKSQFFQMAILQAAGIMAIDIIERERNITHPLPTPEAIAEWNKNHPLDPLTAKSPTPKPLGRIPHSNNQSDH
jgi:hypothetical protein